MIKDTFYLITKVNSDTEVEIDKPVNEIIKEVTPNWKIIPKLDQSGVYKEVCKRLSEGACLGIFPEGGSHDQTDLLPLKAGIALMAFEAMIQYGIDVQIMPVGLNYFQGHRFRSKCLIEYGYPFQVPWEWADIFKQSRQKAIGLLLKELEDNMRDVWTTAPSFKELKRLHTARRIYVPQNMKLDAERSLQLSRRFSTGYRYFKQKYEGTPVFDSFTKQTDSYIQNLKNLGISDHQVTDRLSSKANITLNILWKLCLVLVTFITSLPGLINVGWLLLLISIKAQKSKKVALANSSVKVVGNDVLASYKIIYFLQVIPLYTLLNIIFFTLVYYWYFDQWYDWIFPIIACFVWPFYLYICILSSDTFVSNCKSLYSLIIFKFKNGSVKKLITQRSQLSDLLTDIVEKVGPEVFDKFEQIRIIKKQQEDYDEIASALETSEHFIF